jgi:hypothetical protein
MRLEHDSREERSFPHGRTGPPPTRRAGRAEQHLGAMFDYVTPPKSSTAESLPEGLRPLVRQLVALPASQREQVIRAVREDPGVASLATVPWEEFKELCGIVAFGGDAFEDTEALYDDV